MSITDEVATFIIDYAEKGTNAILLQMNNNKCHEIWLKLAPLLNIMSERSIKFMEWQRIFSNWCENILVKHQQNHPLKPHEERYIELHAKQITSNRAVPSTSTVSQTTEDNSGILDENFIRFVEKISKLEDNWDFPTVTAEIKKFNDTVEKKELSTLEKYMFLTELFINLSAAVESD